MENEDILNRFKSFMQDNKLVKVVAFSGGSDTEGDFVSKNLEECLQYLSGRSIAILTGGTSFGLPKLATKISKDYGFKTIGVMPERGEKYSLGDLLDLKIVIKQRVMGSEFGDESEVFVKFSDGAVIIGGASGTAIEYYHAMKINERRLNPKYNEKPIYLAPISGISGFSEKIYEFEIPEVLRVCLPASKIKNGKSAGQFLIERI